MSKILAIILVSPENPDNIGAVVRAMKNMSLKDLRLVNPPRQWKENAKKMSMAASSMLSDVKVFKTVEAAIKDMQLVIGTTRRQGPKRGSFLHFDEVIDKVKRERAKQNVAVMFGKESKGLDNTSLRMCDWVTTIPVSPEYPSINLAQAVMIVAFSLFDHSIKLPRHLPKRGDFKDRESELTEIEPVFVSKEEMQVTLDRLYETLRMLKYDEKASKASRIRATFHRLFKRSGLLQSEAQMFKGLSRRICEQMKLESYSKIGRKDNFKP